MSLKDISDATHGWLREKLRGLSSLKQELEDAYHEFKGRPSTIWSSSIANGTRFLLIMPEES